LNCGRGWSRPGEVVAHLAEGLLEQAAHLDLRQADHSADLGLAQIAEVPQRDDEPFTAIE
jgi:hypothetical protein